MRNDPKDQDTYTELMRLYEQHPMTFDRFAYVTLGVKDLDSAVATYVDVMQAVPIQDGIDEDLQCKYMTLQLGDCLLQLAQPLEMDSDLGRHVEKWGNCIYSLRWKVLDLDSAEAWLNKQGVRTTRLRENLVYCNVDDTHGAPMFFTTEEIAGDPFAKK
jgi:4-hydroxyphenylpyruvate dioxygenase-like putative hemolysin